jgi:hypothetical protein
MRNLTPEAERTWNRFLASIRIEAERSGLDADDLSSSLDEHLLQMAKASETIDQTRVVKIIGDLRADLDDELNTEAPTDGHHQSRQVLISLGLFVLAVLTFPFVGPLLTVPSWIISRVLARDALHGRQAILLPALLYSLTTLAAGIAALSYFPIVVLVDANLLNDPWTFVLSAGLLLIWTALAVWALQRPSDLMTLLFRPLDSYVRRFVSRRLRMIFLSVGALMLAAGVAGAIYAA